MSNTPAPETAHERLRKWTIEAAERYQSGMFEVSLDLSRTAAVKLLDEYDTAVKAREKAEADLVQLYVRHANTRKARYARGQ